MKHSEVRSSLIASNNGAFIASLVHDEIARFQDQEESRIA